MGKNQPGLAILDSYSIGDGSTVCFHHLLRSTSSVAPESGCCDIGVDILYLSSDGSQPFVGLVLHPSTHQEKLEPGYFSPRMAMHHQDVQYTRLTKGYTARSAFIRTNCLHSYTPLYGSAFPRTDGNQLTITSLIVPFTAHTHSILNT